MLIERIINSTDYDFVRTNDRLKGNIIFLSFGGSYAYGTNIEGSDIDIRGCALNSKSDLLGFSNFEQYIDNKTDTVVYSFNKLINLLLNCNPNVIELLGCRPNHYFMVSKEGKQLLENRKLFLSQKAANSFGGYAIQQLRRLQNALARDSYPQTEKEKHILGSCQSSLQSFHDRFETIPEGSIRLEVGESKKEELKSEIFVDVNLSHYPLRDFNGIISDMSSIIRNYEKLDARNSKKDAVHVNKHAMHLIRLYMMCLDILEKEEIVTYREKDRDFLLSIRNGAFMKEDGTYRPEFFELVNEYEKKLESAKKNTSLPKDPDMRRVEEFVIGVNENIVRGEKYGGNDQR